MGKNENRIWHRYKLQTKNFSVQELILREQKSTYIFWFQFPSIFPNFEYCLSVCKNKKKMKIWREEKKQQLIIIIIMIKKNL